MGNLIWREHRVREETGLSKSTRWRLMKGGQFPQKVQLSSRAVGWRAEEIIQWCKERCEAQNKPVAKGKGIVE
jgi:prophage regulatory protein